MLVSTVVELSSFALNFAAAMVANSLTLWTNTLRVGLDLFATLFAFYVIRRIALGSHARYDYGLGKWENLAAMANVLVMICALGFIGWTAFYEVFHPHRVTGTEFGVGVLASFLGANLWLLARFWRLLQRDSSPVIRSQFILYRNATMASLVSFVAVLLPLFAQSDAMDTAIDVTGCVILGGIVFYGVCSLTRQSLSALLDEALEESLQIKIMRALAESYADYAQFHRVRSRRSGNQIFIDLFLEFDPSLTVAAVLDRSDRIKHLVEELVPKSDTSIVLAEHRQRR